jgi:hypothetical protein
MSRFTIHTLGYDLFEGRESPGVAPITHPVAHMNAFAGFANQAPLALEEDAPLLLFRHGPQTPQLVGDLSAAKKWFKNERMPVSKNLRNPFLHNPIQRFFIDAGTQEAVSRRQYLYL